jgi:hypothetical protein
MLNARSHHSSLLGGPKLGRIAHRSGLCAVVSLASRSQDVSIHRRPLHSATLSSGTCFGSHPAPGGARVFCFGFAALAGLGTSLKGTRQECKHSTLGAGTTRMALPSVP